MRTILPICAVALLALCSAEHGVAAEELTDPATMNEKVLLAQVRLLKQEEMEISRRAVRQASSEKVRAFAKRVAARSEALDKKLTDLGKAAGVEKPQPGSKPLFERLNAIEKLQGEAFDADYLKLALDFHREHIVIYERLAKVATSEPLRNFAREALAEERSHLKTAEHLVAPLIPEAKPVEK
jgi:predicted outer membrane protein